MLLDSSKVRIYHIHSFKAFVVYALGVFLMLGVAIYAYTAINSDVLRLALFSGGVIFLVFVVGAIARINRLVHWSKAFEIISYASLGWIAAPALVYLMLWIPEGGYSQADALEFTQLLARFLISPRVHRYTLSNEDYLEMLPQAMSFYLPVWTGAILYLVLLWFRRGFSVATLFKTSRRFLVVTVTILAIIFLFSWRRFGVTYAIFIDWLIVFSVLVLILDVSSMQSLTDDDKRWLSKVTVPYFLVAFISLLSFHVYRESRSDYYYNFNPTQHQISNMDVIYSGFSKRQKNLLRRKFGSIENFRTQLREHLQ